MFFLKVVFYNCWLPLSTSKVSAYMAQHFMLRIWALTSHCVCFDILVKQFIRVQFWTIGWQEKQSQSSGMTSDPPLHFNRPVHRMAVENQKHLSLTMTNQPPEKRNHHVGSKPLLEYHKCHLAQVGDCRYQVATEPSSRVVHTNVLPDDPIATPSHLHNESPRVPAWLCAGSPDIQSSATAQLL